MFETDYAKEEQEKCDNKKIYTEYRKEQGAV